MSSKTPVAGDMAGASTQTKLYYNEIIMAGEAALNNLKEDFNPQKAKIWEIFLRSLKKYEQDHQRRTRPNDISQASNATENHHHLRRIGEKLECSEKIIAKGSNGTVIFEGSYDGRDVAVKRLVQSHHEVAFKEIEHLRESDHHQNIVRYYGVERDRDFVYLALERCICNLDDLVHIYSVDSSPYEDVSFDCKNYHLSTSDVRIYREDRLEPLKDVLGDFSLGKQNGHPSPSLLKLMREIVCGIVHMHELGIIHRDLKPQNVLIIKGNLCLCAKLSDMGISKRLPENMSSLTHHSTGCGTSGWKAPEMLCHGRQTRAMDLFSLGCILFFCVTRGRHPFGDDHDERNINIKRNSLNLLLLDDFPEALHLISHLLNPDPNLRPKAIEVLNHPLLWDSEKRVLFLCEVSNMVGSYPYLYKELESTARASLGTKWKLLQTWDNKLHKKIIAHTQSFVKKDYSVGSVRDLLRLIRNLWSHYQQLPNEIKEIVGPLYEGFDGYFTNLFPKLLIEVYKVVCDYCKEEDCFKKYFRGN